MRKIIIILIFSLLQMNIWCDSKVDNLLEERKYSSAMKYLNTMDPQNTDLNIVIQKLDIFLEYFAQSINHEIFGLKDLSQLETIDDLREHGGEFEVYTFDAPLIFSKFNNKNIVNPNLIRFYVSLHKCYSETEKYQNPISTSISLANDIDNNLIRETDAAYIGQESIRNNDPQNGIHFYNISISKNMFNPEYNYNLAYADIMLGDYHNAIPYIKNAYEYYEDNKLKNDAYLMLGDAYLHDQNFNLAISIFNELLEQEGNFYISRKLIQAYIKNGDIQIAEKLTVEYLLMIQAQESPIYKLANSFLEISDIDNFIKFSNSSITEYDKNKERNAMIYFYQSYVYYKLDKSEESKNTLIKAKNELLNSETQNEDLLKRINQML